MMRIKIAAFDEMKDMRKYSDRNEKVGLYDQTNAISHKSSE